MRGGRLPIFPERSARSPFAVLFPKEGDVRRLLVVVLVLLLLPAAVVAAAEKQESLYDVWAEMGRRGLTCTVLDTVPSVRVYADSRDLSREVASPVNDFGRTTIIKYDQEYLWAPREYRELFHVISGVYHTFIEPRTGAFVKVVDASIPLLGDNAANLRRQVYATPSTSGRLRSIDFCHRLLGRIDLVDGILPRAGVACGNRLDHRSSPQGFWMVSASGARGVRGAASRAPAERRKKAAK